jgi:signal transduction histidine kinase
VWFSLEAVRKRWGKIRTDVEIADVGFLLLRAAALGGIYGWLFLSDIPKDEVRIFLWISRYFIAYSLFIYLLLFLRFERKKLIYSLSLAFDLFFVYLLITHSGGFDSSFFIGFYLLTALHSFYYGYRYGLLVAAGCTGVYMMSVLSVAPPDWLDFSLRASFLFLIAVPIGMLSAELRRDKQKIESLNEELLRSIDELNRLQDKLIHAEKLSALGRLTSDVAHEIRNPLTVVGGFARRLEKRLVDNTKEKDYARIIVSEVGRLERILKDVLIFSREAKSHIRYANINEILPEIEQVYGDICRERGIRLSVSPERRVPPCIADKDQLRQAVSNLVTNAIDAMPEGGALILRTRTEKTNGVNYAVIDVVDSGVGIPREKVDRIFEPFYSTKEVGHGTGLGLSICKKIMEEHKGGIKVKSVQGEGSTFSLYVPYLPGEETFKVQCWEFTGCGADKAEEPSRRCPAYPSYGRICWSVAGTLSETKTQCVPAEKLGDCRKCEFYRRVLIAQDL